MFVKIGVQTYTKFRSYDQYNYLIVPALPQGLVKGVSPNLYHFADNQDIFH